VVPFGPAAQGIVLRRSAESPVAETRPIESLVDPVPVLTPAQLALADWLHRTTRAPLGECIGLMIPVGLAQHSDQLYTLIDPAIEPPSETAIRLGTLLRDRGPLRGRQIERHLPRRIGAARRTA
jgi:primosomal protein N' (replication factor Y)